MKHALREIEEAPSGLERNQQLGDPLSPYLRSDEAARYLRFGSAKLFREWVIREHVPTRRRGRTLLFDRRVLEAYVGKSR